MAVDLPSQLTDETRPRRFLRGNSVVSGDAAADESYGTKGASSAQNHVYSNGRSLGGLWEPDDTALISDAVAAIAWTDVTEECPMTFGADIIKIRVHAWIERGSIRIWFDDGTGPYTSTASGVKTTTAQAGSTLTLPASTGITGRVKIQYLRVDTFTFKLYGFELFERPMLVADFP